MPGESQNPPPEIDPLDDYRKMKWFGVDWQAPVNDDCEEIPTPIGSSCTKCHQEILLLDSGFAVPRLDELSYAFFHRKCFLEEILGPELAPIVENRMEEKENASQEPPS